MVKRVQDGGLNWGFEYKHEEPPMHIVRGDGEDALCGARTDSVATHAPPIPMCLKCVRLLKVKTVRGRK